MKLAGRKLRRALGSGLSYPPKLPDQSESHELDRLWTGLFWVALSPTQKMVVTMLVFHGYRPEIPRLPEVVGTKTLGSICERALSRSFMANFAKSSLLL